MRHRLEASGFTLIEAMIAMAIVLIGALGLCGLFDVGLRMNGDAHHMLRATAIAQDLVETIGTWPYQDNVAGTSLADVSTGNDADIADAALHFQTSADPVADGWADHGEETVAAMGASWTGIPTGDLGQYQRFWNVVYLDSNGDGVNDEVQIAVIVRWPHGDGWRRVVLVSGMLNPGGR